MYHRVMYNNYLSRKTSAILLTISLLLEIRKAHNSKSNRGKKEEKIA